MPSPSASSSDAPEAPAVAARRVEALALECGFDRAGVASAEPLEHGDAFLDWIAEGRQGEMRYLANRVECRLDPRELRPWVRSIVCVALQYANGIESSDETDLWRGVARYARGADYHDLMEKRLRRLEARLAEEFPGVRTWRYVDTGPVLERELAARAGLGAVGKNTNLLDETAGSYFFLGELFVSLDLEPGVPVEDLCGSCTACLDACPTAAFPEPYVLDSRRCISYWTIEHRGAAPAEVLDGLGAWSFGCDVCQEVCPWNSKPLLPVDRDLELPPARARLGLVDLLRLGREEYRDLFRRSAMKRAKLEGLKRNAAVAMGNLGRQEYVPALGEALHDGDEDLRRVAARALGRIGGEAPRALLREALEGASEDLRGELEAALGSTPESVADG